MIDSSDTNSNNKITLSGTLPLEAQGQRFDAAIAALFPEYSRARIKTWILAGACLVNNCAIKPKDKAQGLEEVTINATLQDANNWEAEVGADYDLVEGKAYAPTAATMNSAAAIEYIYQDDDIIVINKPKNLVVHPGAGNFNGTLVNILLRKFPELKLLPRAGIVHRLDKDTTGLMVVARSIGAHASLVKQLQERTVKRTYDAIVWGVRPAGGTVDLPIIRHPKDRTKMAIANPGSGKEAVSHFRIVEKFATTMHIKVMLETGRTHQIRIHMSHISLPLVGDTTYGRSRLLPNAKIAANVAANEVLKTFKRQALHASKLELWHPIKKEMLLWEVAMPADMQQLLTVLRAAE
jgi:23S rRNA pseudouridine1911/1915/1917 synthase